MGEGAPQKGAKASHRCSSAWSSSGPTLLTASHLGEPAFSYTFFKFMLPTK